jgi:hypothetical protein
MQKNNAKDMDISKLTNGVYMMMIYDENNNLIKVERVVKNGQ